jgi:hypothetical protein
MAPGNSLCRNLLHPSDDAPGRSVLYVCTYDRLSLSFGCPSSARVRVGSTRLTVTLLRQPAKPVSIVEQRYVLSLERTNGPV